MLNAVILAGSSKIGELEEQENVDNKAFIKVNHLSALEAVLETLRGVRGLEKIVIVGPEDKLEEVREKGYQFEITPQWDNLIDNIAAGLERMDPQKPCVAMSADIPLLTVEAVEDFVERCEPFNHDFYYPVISKEVYQTKFPQGDRTYVPLREGVYTGGNLMIIKPYWLLEKLDEIHKYVSYRKRPWKLVRTLPLSLIVKFLCKRLQIHELENYMSKLLGIQAKVVETPYVEIGVDMDKPADLKLIKEVVDLSNET